MFIREAACQKEVLTNKVVLIKLILSHFRLGRIRFLDMKFLISGQCRSQPFLTHNIVYFFFLIFSLVIINIS